MFLCPFPGVTHVVQMGAAHSKADARRHIGWNNMKKRVMISQSVVTLVWHSTALLSPPTFTSKFSCLQCMTSWQPIEEPGLPRNIFTAWGELVVLVPKVEVCYCYMTSNEARQIISFDGYVVMSITCQVRCLPDLLCRITWTCRQNKIGT